MANKCTLVVPSLSDITPVFNLIQEGSRCGQFSNLYLRPRYMAGLGIQLFSVWLLKSIKLPDGIWHQANLKILRVDNHFAGFIMLRREAHELSQVEIYMCGVAENFRNKGLGEWMLRTAIAEIPSCHKLFAY